MSSLPDQDEVIGERGRTIVPGKQIPCQSKDLHASLPSLILTTSSALQDTKRSDQLEEGIATTALCAYFHNDAGTTNVDYLAMELFSEGNDTSHVV